MTLCNLCKTEQFVEPTVVGQLLLPSVHPGHVCSQTFGSRTFDTTFIIKVFQQTALSCAILEFSVEKQMCSFSFFSDDLHFCNEHQGKKSFS